MVIWLIGLAGAGKTTVGREVAGRLRAEGRPVVQIDGDDVRRIVGDEAGHDLADRRRNADRVCRLCRHVESQGVDVVCGILSMFRESREWNRVHYDHYVEVFLDTPRAVLERRDQGGLYSGARDGRVRDVAGIDLPFEPPENPDVTVSGRDATRPAAEIAEMILHAAAIAR